jgi:F-type H+-transporting ATPase subunit epsilon
MSTFLLEIATPERLLLREQVSEAQIPAKQGELGVRPEHAPLIAELGIGVLSYVCPSGRKALVVAGGVVEVLPDRCRVLADVAEYADEVDAKRAQEAVRRASERLTHPELGVDVGRALNALRRAQARVNARASTEPRP